MFLMHAFGINLQKYNTKIQEQGMQKEKKASSLK